MTIFVKEDFISSAGLKLDFKIECDGLDRADIETLAYIISKRYMFQKAIGIPRGGVELAKTLEKYSRPEYDEYPWLIIDDVLTTGRSMNEMRKSLKKQFPDKVIWGVVVFARGKCDLWITPIFRMWGG